MSNVRYKAEFKPELRLVIDEAPPLGTKIWLVNVWGTGVDGQFYEGGKFIAWAPLPKFSPEQKARIEALQQAGVDLTQVKRRA